VGRAVSDGGGSSVRHQGRGNQYTGNSYGWRLMTVGEATALIGSSGCVESTFLRILNRMHELIPSAGLAGEVLLDGTDLYDPSRRQIGMAFQKPDPFPAMTICENVVASLKLTGQRTADYVHGRFR
jgi:ABC-type phosphate transport system ATPase subunit